MFQPKKKSSIFTYKPSDGLKLKKYSPDNVEQKTSVKEVLKPEQLLKNLNDQKRPVALKVASAPKQASKQVPKQVKKKVPKKVVLKQKAASLNRIIGLKKQKPKRKLVSKVKVLKKPIKKDKKKKPKKR